MDRRGPRGCIIEASRLEWTADDPWGQRVWGEFFGLRAGAVLEPSPRCHERVRPFVPPGGGGQDPLGNLLYHPFAGQGPHGARDDVALPLPCLEPLDDDVLRADAGDYGGVDNWGVAGDEVDTNVLETTFRQWIESRVTQFNEPEFALHQAIHIRTVVGRSEVQEFSIAPAALQWFAVIAVQDQEYEHQNRVRIGLFEQLGGAFVTNHLPFGGWDEDGNVSNGDGVDPAPATYMVNRANAGPPGARPEQIVRLQVTDHGSGPDDYDPSRVRFVIAGAIGSWTCGYT